MSNVVQQTGGVKLIYSDAKPITNLQSKGDFLFDSETLTATESYTCRADLWLQLMPIPQRTCHQLYPWCIVKKSTYKQDRRGGAGTYTVTFAVTLLNADQLPPPQVEYDTSTEELELDTHPRFVTEIGGSWEAPLHGAIFDPDTHEWKGFEPKLSDGSPNPWFGARSWKARFRVIRETVHEFGGVGAEAVGYVLQHVVYGKVFYNHHSAILVANTVTQNREYLVLSGNIQDSVITILYGNPITV